MTDARLVDLEVRYMKLEEFVRELSDVVAAQGKTIDALVSEMKRLREQVDTEEGEGDEPPPHY